MARPDPTDTAQALVAERFAAARAAWLGGSAVREDATATSDLDITVLLPGPPAPFRESLLHDGWPVELFVHTETSLAHYRGTDLARRQPTIMRLVGESVVLVDDDGSGARLQADCQAQVAAGPEPLTADELASARYAVTDLLDDLAGATEQGERTAVAVALWEQAANLLLTGARHWSGTGKGLLREVRALDRATGSTHADALVAGLHAATTGDIALLCRACEQILAPHGGRLFAGHRLDGRDPDR
ncbi:MAG: nucleotidyltransferase domain-containing protein [Propionibacteriales bacterium]|nr:nucleotidyltransferase domain-containing protein [Propionibacteriales bacterium]